MLSVFIDTVLCTATAFMCMFSGVIPTKELAGAPYVQAEIAVQVDFGAVGPILITVAMVLFAFTTLIGNLFYVDNCLNYHLNPADPWQNFAPAFFIICRSGYLRRCRHDHGQRLGCC